MRILKWLGAVALVVTGLFFASTARRHKLRSDRLVDAQVKAHQSKKSNSLKKAQALDKKIDSALAKSKTAKEKSKLWQKKLEERNETSLASRVSGFNDRL